MWFEWVGFAFGFLSFFYFGFLAYASVMNRGGWSKLTIEGKIFAGPWLLVFGVGDYAFNWTFGSIIFLQFPGWSIRTLSRRMAHNIATTPNSWRGKIAAWVVGRDLIPYTKEY